MRVFLQFIPSRKISQPDKLFPECDLLKHKTRRIQRIQIKLPERLEIKSLKCIYVK